MIFDPAKDREKWENRLGRTICRIIRGKVRPGHRLIGSLGEEHRVSGVDIPAHLLGRAIQLRIL